MSEEIMGSVDIDSIDNIDKLEFSIPTFKGPMELLLHLLQKNKIDIYDIPIADITSQFIEYMKAFEKSNIELSSEFLLMASQLIEIKSKMLLPIYEEGSGDVDFDENDPRYELVQRLLEYKKYKDASSTLEIGYSENGGIFLKDSRINLDDYEYIKSKLKEREKPIDASILLEAIEELMMKVPELDIMREKYFLKVQDIRKNYVSVESKISILKDIILTDLNRDSWSFEELAGAKDNSTVIVTFLAILELLKIVNVKVRQDEAFGSIVLDRVVDENKR